MQCPVCRQEVDPGSRRCPWCGNRLAEAPASPEATAGSPPPVRASLHELGVDAPPAAPDDTPTPVPGAPGEDGIQATLMGAVSPVEPAPVADPVAAPESAEPDLAPVSHEAEPPAAPAVSEVPQPSPDEHPSRFASLHALSAEEPPPAPDDAPTPVPDAEALEEMRHHTPPPAMPAAPVPDDYERTYVGPLVPPAEAEPAAPAEPLDVQRTYAEPAAPAPEEYERTYVGPAVIPAPAVPVPEPPDDYERTFLSDGARQPAPAAPSPSEPQPAPQVAHPLQRGTLQDLMGQGGAAPAQPQVSASPVSPLATGAVAAVAASAALAGPQPLVEVAPRAPAAPAGPVRTFCPHCGNPLAGASAFCPTCGAALTAPSEVYCSACGYHSPASARFCMRCGASMVGAGVLPPATRPRRRRRLRWWFWVLVLPELLALPLVLYILLHGAGRSDAPPETIVITDYGSVASAPLAWPEPIWVGSATIHAETGAELLIDDPASPLAGLLVVVPAGAVPLGAPLDLRVGYASEPVLYQPRDLLAEDVAIYTQLVARVEDHNASADAAAFYSPILAPLALSLGEYELISPFVMLEPAGTSFAWPVQITMPVDVEDSADLSDSLGLVVMGRSVSADGLITWEVIDGAQFDAAAGTVTFETEHFSGWGAWLWRKAQNVAYAGWLNTVGSGTVSDLKANLPQDTLQRLMTGAVCSGRTLKSDYSKLPSQWQLGTFLGAGGGGSRGILDPQFAVVEEGLTSWVRGLSPRLNPQGADTRQPGTVGPEHLFQRAMELADGDVIQALVACHSVLRQQRNSQPVVELLRPYRPAGPGVDQSGAYYHLFGTALYAFMNEYYQEHLSKVYRVPVSPEELVQGEETYFASEAGDIWGDTQEYAVDL